MNPVSAVKIVDKGSNAIYSEKYNSTGTFTYVTYKINSKHFKTYGVVYIKGEKLGKLQFDLKKVSSKKIKLTTYATANGQTYRDSAYEKTKMSVSTYYFTYMKDMLSSFS